MDQAIGNTNIPVSDRVGTVEPSVWIKLSVILTYRGAPGCMQYINNIKKWARASLEENISVTEDRTAWRERNCPAGAANVRTDDAD